MAKNSVTRLPISDKQVKMDWIATQICEAIYDLQKLASFGQFKHEFLETEPFKRLLRLKEQWEAMYIANYKEVK